MASLPVKRAVTSAVHPAWLIASLTARPKTADRPSTSQQTNPSMLAVAVPYPKRTQRLYEAYKPTLDSRAQWILVVLFGSLERREPQASASFL